MLLRFCLTVKQGLFLGQSLVSFFHKYPKKSKKVVFIKSERPPTVKERTMKIYTKQTDLERAQEVVKLPLKDFSVQVHHLVVAKQKSAVFWSTVENSFLERLQPTSDPVVIRSYAKIVYALSKSKQASGNYETQMSLLLPFASHQSFTTIVTALSRIAPYSTEFAYIVEKLYYKRRGEFNPREQVSINYSLANNGRPCDVELIKNIDDLNCVQTITMLRCYDMSDFVTPELLRSVLKKLKSIKREFNVLDLSDFINIYLKHKFTGEGFEEMIEESYTVLRRNVDDVCLQKIWEFIPQSVNEGRLRVKFVQDVIETILILRMGKTMGEVSWKRVKATFDTIDNIELKLKLQRIY